MLKTNATTIRQDVADQETKPDLNYQIQEQIARRRKTT